MEFCFLYISSLELHITSMLLSERGLFENDNYTPLFFLIFYFFAFCLQIWQKRTDPVCHIELRRWADLMVIAPLSANTLAKLANGICDNLLVRFRI